MSQTTTQATTASAAPDVPAKLQADSGLPNQLDGRFRDFAKLSREQCGHLRHFHNLVSALDGEWGLMGGQDPDQEWGTAYRYQLSCMAYAAGAAHFHRLPAMRSMFKTLMERIINKMLRKEVWTYWYLLSQSGVKCDPDIEEMRKPWADPCLKENIMYSGHLLMMISLYAMLFADDKYDAPGSLSFDWDPIWGMTNKPTSFKYSRLTLQEAIMKDMEREKWLGVCCEPNVIFIVCNMFPIIGFRYNDAVDGTNNAELVVEKYRAAWAKTGLLDNNGLFKQYILSRQGRAPDSEDATHSAWAMAFMPWNYDLIQSLYSSSTLGFVHRLPDRINLQMPEVAMNIKALVKEEGVDPEASFTVARALEKAKAEANGEPLGLMKNEYLRFRYKPTTFGHMAQWFCEVADESDLSKLLRHADQYMNPAWKDGGLYYKREDEGWDDQGNYIHVEPYTGNASIRYARLNVQHGQKKMWDHPWTPDQVNNRPWIDGVGLDDNIDTLRGVWDDKEQAMVATFKT
ncbi:hypothetical protein ACHAPT_011959 [Fusarium lateritium]